MRKLVVALFVVIFWLISQPATLAHPVLLRSNPADGAALSTAPSRAVLEFNRDLDQPAYVILTGPSGRLPTGAVTVSGKTLTAPIQSGPDGRYGLAFKVVSVDGHPITGQINYTVGDSSERSNQNRGGSAQSWWHRNRSILLISGLLAVLATTLLALAILKNRDPD